MGIRTEEVVEPREALKKILVLVAKAEASKRFDAALLKKIVQAANHGLIGREDWAFATEKEKTSATFIAEQDALEGLDNPKSLWMRKYAAQPKPKLWYNEPPAGHPHTREAK